ncbi:MAG TPA: N-6 DNA methylase, partial [Acidimicrobiales bacterium]|nr:N-6 DNA methylase [Acidimicrobiales bacterium]
AAVVLDAVRVPARRRGLVVEDLMLWRLAAGPGSRRAAGPGAGGGVVALDVGTGAGGGPPPTGAGAGGGAGPQAAPGPLSDPAGLAGAALEQATGAGRRRALGLHVTPAWLAEDLTARALAPWAGALTARAVAPPVGGRPGRELPTVCDPACGGGAFLVAGARWLHARGVPAGQVVRDLVWGADIDPVGVAAAEAALALWAGEIPPPGRLVVADALCHGREAWPALGGGRFATVVGNPPFQSQLGRLTARSAEERRLLRARYGDAVRAYTDTAWLFLLLALELVAPRGRVVLVQPRSVIAARDAAAVRRAVAGGGELLELWLDEGRAFGAAVRVCAPVVERRAAPDGQPAGLGAPAGSGGGPRGAAGSGPGRGEGDAAGAGDGGWRAAWARAVGLPEVAIGADVAIGPDVAGGVDVVSGTAGDGAEPAPAGTADHRAGAPVPRARGGAAGTLGDRADIVAGFRDQYYALAGAVRERAELPEGVPVAPLLTCGVLDWAGHAWGRRPTRYARRTWQAPVVDPRRLAAAPAVARRWVARTAAPKLVVASQTRVVEAAVDVAGGGVPSVPALAVVPRDPEDLWRLAAAVLSPAASAWLAWRGAGTALDGVALRVAGPDLASLPLPADPGAWAAAAEAVRAHAATPAPASLYAFLAAAEQAYGVDPEVTAWWWGRAGPAVRGPEGSG